MYSQSDISVSVARVVIYYVKISVLVFYAHNKVDEDVCMAMYRLH